MIGRIRPCSWCHEGNECPRGELVWCANCGHRADVPRLLCNCSVCLTIKGTKERIERERAARQRRAGA